MKQIVLARSLLFALLLLSVLSFGCTASPTVIRTAPSATETRMAILAPTPLALDATSTLRQVMPTPSATRRRRLTQTPRPYTTATPSPTRPPSATPLPTPKQRPWAAGIKNVLPAPLYFLAPESGSAFQIWRGEKDARTITRISKPGEKVLDFDVSPITGELAFVTERGLFISDARGTNTRSVEVKGANGAFTFSNPNWIGLSWSRDGTRLALGAGNRILIYIPGEDRFVPIESHMQDLVAMWPLAPSAWSPDGKRLLLGTAVGMDSGGIEVLNLDDQSLYSPRDVLSTCGSTTWSIDGRSIYFAQDFYTIAYCGSPGLRRWDIDRNKIVELLPFRWNADLPLAHGAEEAPDGQLYYFAGSAFVPENTTSGYTAFAVRMHRSPKNDLTNPTLLRSDAYKLEQVLWAGDLSLAVIVDSSAMGSGSGKIIILTTDNKPPLTLAKAGFHLRWGKP